MTVFHQWHRHLMSDSLGKCGMNFYTFRLFVDYSEWKSVYQLCINPVSPWLIHAQSPSASLFCLVRLWMYMLRFYWLIDWLIVWFVSLTMKIYAYFPISYTLFILSFLVLWKWSKYVNQCNYFSDIYFHIFFTLHEVNHGNS